jgi:hypothetical protein
VSHQCFIVFNGCCSVSHWKDVTTRNTSCGAEDPSLNPASSLRIHYGILRPSVTPDIFQERKEKPAEGRDLSELSTTVFHEAELPSQLWASLKRVFSQTHSCPLGPPHSQQVSLFLCLELLHVSQSLAAFSTSTHSRCCLGKQWNCRLVWSSVQIAMGVHV